MTDVKITLELDDELIADYLGGFAEAFEQVEENIRQLNDGGGSQEIYNDILRHLHSIKGNARMCELRLPEKIAHVIEDVVIAVKEGEVSYFPDMGETIQVALEKVKESSLELFNKQELDEDNYLELTAILAAMVSDMSSAVKLTNQFLHITTYAPLHDEVPDAVPLRNIDDLRLVRLIGERYKSIEQKAVGRIARLIEVALKLNEFSGVASDPVQLEAAICLLELDPAAEGIETILTKFDIHDSSNIAVDLLASMQGWQTACDILSGINVEAGVMLSLCQYYDDQTYPTEGRDRKRAIINTLMKLASGEIEQFSGQWADLLSQVVKKILKSSA